MASRFLSLTPTLGWRVVFVFFLLFRIKPVHARFDSLMRPDDDGLGRLDDRVLDHRPLAGPKPSQHVIDRFVLRPADPDPQPGILGHAEVLLDASQAVM